MPWLTEILGRPVVDEKGKVVGRIRDLVAEPGRFPRVTSAALMLNGAGRQRLGSENSLVVVPWESLSRPNGRLVVAGEPGWQEIKETDLKLREELLDRQIVDIEGARVVRVNDVWLSESAGGIRVVGADVGIGGILRQLGLEGIARRLAQALDYEIPERLIAWNYLAPLEEERGQVRLTVPGRLLKELRPSDLADILEQLDPERRERILRVMTDSDLAETLSEIDPAVSREAVEALGEDRVRRVLELMPPDEATDILGQLPYEAAERLLSLMGVGQASVLRELLGYPPDTAGGRMTPYFVAVPASYTVDEAIKHLRREAARAETVYFAYVLDEYGRLRGVLSLRQLLRSDPHRRVDDIMEVDIVSVRVDDDQEQVALLMARYDLLVLPVVDDEDRLKGIVTVDDIVQVLEEEASEDLSEVTGVYLGEGPAVRTGRLAGFALSLIAGAGAAFLLESQRAILASAIAVAWFLPLYIRIAQDLGTWSLARALRWATLGPRRRLEALSQELIAALVSAAASGLLVGIFGTWWTGTTVGTFLGVGIFVGSLVASLIGLALPAIVRTLRLDWLLARGRLLVVVVGMASLLVYVWALGSLASRLA